MTIEEYFAVAASAALALKSVAATISEIAVRAKKRDAAAKLLVGLRTGNTLLVTDTELTLAGTWPLV